MQIKKSDINKWIKALRSGKFKQTKGHLQDSKGYCCLGVACKALIPEDKLLCLDGFLIGSLPYDQPYAPKWLIDINDHFSNLTAFKSHELKDSSIFAGIRFHELNDHFDFNFNEIADLLQLVYIEKTLD